MGDSILLEHEDGNECFCAGRIILGMSFHTGMHTSPSGYTEENKRVKQSKISSYSSQLSTEL